MIKKAKYFLSSSARTRIEDMVRREWKRFSWASVIYLLLVWAAAYAGAQGEYNLHGDSINGFALWFLLLPAYLSLGVISIFTWYFNFQIPYWGHEAYFLGICNTAQIAVIWIILSLVAFQRKRPMVLRHAGYFVRILIVWGFFQLACCGARGLWEHGGFSSLHHDSGAAAAGQK